MRVFVFHLRARRHVSFNIPREKHEPGPDKPYRERQKRSIDLRPLDKKESYQNKEKWTWSQLFMWFVLGPFSSLEHNGRSEYTKALEERILELEALKHNLNNASVLDLYLERVAREKKISKRSPSATASAALEVKTPAYPYPLGKTRIKIQTDYRWYDIVAGILCPFCWPLLQENAEQRTYQEYIEVLKRDITNKVSSTNLDAVLASTARQGKLNYTNGEYLNRRKRTTEMVTARSRRGVVETISSRLLDQVFSQAAGVFMGNVVSNLVSAAWERFYPHSNTNRIRKLEETFEDMKKNFDIDKQINRGILDNIDKLSNIVQEAVKRIDSHVRSFPQYTWLSSLIINRMTQSGLDMQRVTDEAKKGRLAIEPFVRLTNIHELKELSTANTKILEIKPINEYTVNFVFLAMIESQDTKVYRVHAFDHWDNLDEVPRLLHYTGAPYLIYNETSNCIRSLSSAPDDYIGEQCTELDGTDPALNEWTATTETYEIEKFAGRSQVRKTFSHNYIYCFPGNITIENVEYKCPFDVFRLKYTLKFRTAQQRHDPSQTSINATLRELAIDTVHAGHFRSDSDVIQHLALFEKLREERKNLTVLNEQIGTSFVVKRNDPWLWLGIGTVMLSWLATITYLVIVVWFRKGTVSRLSEFATSSMGPTPPTPSAPPTLKLTPRPTFATSGPHYSPLQSPFTSRIYP